MTKKGDIEKYLFMKITVHNLIYSYPNSNNFNALNDVSFEIDQTHNFVIISGASGSGKTTLLYALEGLITPQQGKILFDEEDVCQMNQKELASFRNEKVGFVFQNYLLDESLNIVENVYLPAIILGKEDKKTYIKRAQELLLSVGINEDQFKKKPTQLSGGQQQRVAIARALINKPNIIMADEPTGNLDSKNAIMIIELLKSLIEKENIKVILVTHETKFYEYGDQIITLSDGKVVKNEF